MKKQNSFGVFLVALFLVGVVSLTFSPLTQAQSVVNSGTKREASKSKQAYAMKMLEADNLFSRCFSSIDNDSRYFAQEMIVCFQAKDIAQKHARLKLRVVEDH